MATFDDVARAGNDVTNDGDITQEDILQLHEDILENNEDSIRELLKEFREDGLPTAELCSQEIEIEPLPDDHHLNRVSLSAIHRAAILESSCILSLLLGSSSDIDLNLPLKSNGHTPLHISSQAGVTSAVNFLAANGANVNALDNDGRSAMHHAALAGETDIAKILVVKGCEADVRDIEGRTPLHMAAENGHVKTVMFLLKRGVDVNVSDAYDHKPLHRAQLQGHADVSDVLLSNGAKCNARDMMGDSPAHILARNCLNQKEPTSPKVNGNHGDEGNLGNRKGSVNGLSLGMTCLEVLLKYGADINLANHQGETPLHVSVMNDNVHVSCDLVHHGCVVDGVDAKMRTPLMYVENDDILAVLLQRGANVRHVDNCRNTVLHRFARNSKVNVELLQMVFSKGADVHALNMMGETPIFGASASNSQEKLDFLVRSGACTSGVNCNKQTILHTAISQDYSKLAAFIAQYLDVPLDVKDVNCNAALSLAVSKRHHDVVVAIAQRGGDVNIRGGDGILPATKAAFVKENCILQFLLDNGAQFEEVVDSFPLHDFAKMGDLKSVMYLVNNNVSLDRTDENKQTALHVAIQGQKWDVVEYLLHQGASVKVSDCMKNSALHLLCKFCNLPQLHVCLLDRSPDLNLPNAESETPLHISATKSCTEMVKLLVNRGADCRIKNAHGRTPLHASAACASSVRDRDELKSVATHIAANGNQAAFDDSDDCGASVLHYLASLGWVEAMNTLLNRRADLNIRDNTSQTPLHRACAAGHLDVAQLLVKRGASMRAQDSRQQTPLYHAVRSGNEELVEFILGCDADPNSLNAECTSPLHTAIGENKFEIAEILIMNEADVNACDVSRRTPLHIASPLSPSHVVESLVLHGSDVNVADKDGRTPLHACVENPEARVMKYLLSQGALVRVKDASGDTPLHLVAKHGCYDKTDLLLTAKAEIDVVNGAGDTPLHLAALNTESDVVELLVANEANPCLTNSDGLTPLMVAARAGNVETAQVLLEHEAEGAEFDPELTDNHGNTSAVYAARQSQFSIALLKSLQEHGVALDKKNKDGESPLSIIKKRKDLDVERIFAALRIS